MSDVGKYFIPYNAFVETTMLYSNKKTWAKLNDEQRTVIRDAAQKAALEYIDQAWARNQDFTQKLKDKGWEILEISDEQRGVMIDQIRDTVWPEAADSNRGR